MQLSAKTEYACLAVLELALHQHDTKPMCLRDIASQHGIPSRFLVQILLQLKAAGLVTSIRGAAGGYRLAREADTITLGEVMSVITGNRSELAQNASINTPLSSALFRVWESVAKAHQDHLDAISLDDLLQMTAGQTEGMYYI